MTSKYKNKIVSNNETDTVLITGHSKCKVNVVKKESVKKKFIVEYEDDVEKEKIRPPEIRTKYDKLEKTNQKYISPPPIQRNPINYQKYFDK